MGICYPIHHYILRNRACSHSFLPGDSLLFVAGAISALPGMPIDIHILVLILFTAAVLGDSCNYMIGHFSDANFFIIPTPGYSNKVILIKRMNFIKIWWENDYSRPLCAYRPHFCSIYSRNGKMHYYYFMIYNLIGGAIWVVLFCYAGYFFGDLPFVQENLKLLIIAIIFISILPAIIEILRAKLGSKQ